MGLITVDNCVVVQGRPGREPRRGPLLIVPCFQVTGDLFDIMSGQTDVDHPLCEECTDTLLDQLDTQLNVTENECQNYKRCLEILEPMNGDDSE